MECNRIQVYCPISFARFEGKTKKTYYNMLLFIFLTQNDVGEHNRKYI
jgi:hypothetical protein